MLFIIIKSLKERMSKSKYRLLLKNFKYPLEKDRWIVKEMDRNKNAAAVRPNVKLFEEMDYFKQPAIRSIEHSNQQRKDLYPRRRISTYLADHRSVNYLWAYGRGVYQFTFYLCLPTKRKFSISTTLTTTQAFMPLRFV